PAGMSRSTFDPRAIAADEDRAVGHDRRFAGIPVMVPMVAAGGWYANLAAAARFVALHLGRGVVAGQQVLSESSWAECYQVPGRQPGQEGGYGLGLAVGGFSHGWEVAGHSGGGFGFLCDLYWLGADGCGVVVLTN